MSIGYCAVPGVEHTYEASIATFLEDAIESLYAVLSEEQNKEADSIVLAMMGIGGMAGGPWW